MSQAKWIWYNGDYELYHSMKLHSRRTEFDAEYPPFWTMPAPNPNAVFTKRYHADEDDIIHVVAPHKAYITVDYYTRYPVNTDIPVPAGDHIVQVFMLALEGFPTIYINSRYLKTDETWVAELPGYVPVPVGCDPVYTEPTDDPREFPFAYSRVDHVKVTKTDAGMLYDFGRETFAILHIEGADPETPIRVTYGESPEEAQDYNNALIRETVKGSDSYALAPRAFRYVCIPTKAAKGLNLWADYQYVRLEDRAYFSCNRRNVRKIWDICAYTLHLNSREFYLDGVKRDRWCWSGDAFQSYMANRYLYFDPAITKRTLIALLGKPPYVQHVNTINDYSMYVIIGAYEHYYATGDRQFIEIYFERIKALYEFIISRLDEAGYMCARKGDWVFMDWSDMDKDGPLCAEQVLLWQTHRVMAQMAELLGLDSTRYQKAAAKLKSSIIRDYWREDRGAFVDSYTSGKENVTRHANIFAIMYDFVSPTRAKKIVRCVLENDEVNAITTPYFAFFELNVLCKMGKLRTAQKKIESYWGGMVALGATTIWEQFIPEHKGAEHYAMYGKPYGCSLCHAWGGGPIYLLGRYCVGVYPTSVGYETYAVQPDRGMYKHFEGKVPLPEGDEVSVKMDAHTCTVTTTRPGGTLILKGQQYEIPVGVPFTVNY